MQVISVITGRVSPVISAMVTIVAFALLGNDLRAGDVFATIAIFQSMRLAVITLPMAIIAISTIRTSVRRLQYFLTTRSHPGRNILKDRDGDGGDGRNGGGEHAVAGIADSVHSGAVVVTFKQATLSWGGVGRTPAVTPPARGGQSAKSGAVKSSAAGHVRAAGKRATTTTAPSKGDASDTVLRDVSFTAAAGTLTGIVGAVGSGKTTLIMGLIGELEPVTGAIACHKSLGYVPQHPFVFSGTILENVLFGRPYVTLSTPFPLPQTPPMLFPAYSGGVGCWCRVNPTTPCRVFIDSFRMAQPPSALCPPVFLTIVSNLPKHFFQPS